jgi:hypothetical protein
MLGSSMARAFEEELFRTSSLLCSITFVLYSCSFSREYVGTFRAYKEVTTCTCTQRNATPPSPQQLERFRE